MSIAFDQDLRETPARSAARLPLVLGLLALSTMIAVGARIPIVSLAPRTAVLFEALGLAVNVKGLAIERVNAKILADGDRRVLVVEGEIVNPGERAQPARSLSVTVYDEGGQSLYSWTTRAPQQEVAESGRAGFVARLASPPASAASVLVEFDRQGADPTPPARGAFKKGVARPLAQGSSTESQ